MGEVELARCKGSSRGDMKVRGGYSGRCVSVCGR